MIREKGIVEVHDGHADTDELLDSVDSLPDGEYGYLLFDKKKNRSLPQLKFLFGYLLKTLSEELEGHPEPEALYRYFEEIYAPIHRCKIPGEEEEFEYFDLKNESTTEMDFVIEKIIHHAMSEWHIDLLSRDRIKAAEAQEAYAGAYAETWKNLSRKNLIVFFSMTEQENMMSALDIFAASQETFEEAKKKSSDESRKRANYLRFSQDGTYAVRILPLAPVIDKDGKVLPMERKGYEYPLRSLMLKIENDKKLVKGKPSITYVTVCDAKQRFNNLKEDLIDLYVSTACDMYADDEALCKKLRSNSFEGGLKWDSKRCMYVIDCDHKEDGLQILQLSFAQYKELEERKLNLWAKLNKKKLVNCPISSIDNGYPLEIIRKTENKKTSYSFNIDTVSGAEPLDEQTLQNLLDARRLPEILYNYTRFHLEATIVYLTQLDKKYDIDVMSSDEIKNCIEQIKTLLPSDDNSHFSMDGGSSNNAEAGSNMNDLDALWERFDKLDEAGLDDESAEGQELRTSIKEFIEDNDLDIQIKRSKSNQDLLDECEKALGGSDNDDDDEEEEEKPAPKKSARKDPEPEEEEEENDDDNNSGEEENNDNEEEEEEEEQRPRSSRRERNDDTNEPAARSVRRGARPNRRR